VRRETLRRWEREGKIDPPERTPSGQRRYDLATLRHLIRKIVLPLCGKGRIDGNVRIVLEPERGRAAVHMQCPVRTGRTTTSEVVGLDAGVTEMLAPSRGEKYGPGFGHVLDRPTEETTEQGNARNQLRAAARKAEARGNHAKARRILRRNLGAGKLRRRRAKGEAEVRRQVGEAVRQVLADPPSVVVIEDLPHLRGQTKRRKLSRTVSRWMRSALRERFAFRTQAGGSRLVTVNAAYTRQTCPNRACGYVHKANRHGDRFQCLRWGYAGDADVVAAMNTAMRMNDPDIHPWTPKEKVRDILLARFRRRSEGASALTAPGRPPAAARPASTDDVENHTLRRRAKKTINARGGY
jgi:IS605 OrfB family transposase